MKQNELAMARRLGLAPPLVPRKKRNPQPFEEGHEVPLVPDFALEKLTPEPSQGDSTSVSEAGTTVPEGSIDGTSVPETSTAVLEDSTETQRPWESGLRTPPTPGRSPEPEERAA